MKREGTAPCNRRRPTIALDQCRGHAGALDLRPSLYQHHLAGAIAGIGPAERTAPRADLRAGRFDQFALEMNQLALAQRFAQSCHPRFVRRNDVQIRAVRDDLFLRDRRRHWYSYQKKRMLWLIFSRSSTAWSDIGPHPTARSTGTSIAPRIVAIDFPVQNARIEREARERLEVEKGRVGTATTPLPSSLLLRLRCDQNAGRIDRSAT